MTEATKTPTPERAAPLALGVGRAAASYTAGPWHARRVALRQPGYGVLHGYEIDADGWQGLATVHVSNDEAILARDADGPTPTGDHNAALVAAAPMLYEALADVVRLYTTDGWDQGEALPDAIRQARRALREAV